MCVLRGEGPFFDSGENFARAHHGRFVAAVGGKRGGMAAALHVRPIVIVGADSP